MGIKFDYGVSRELFEETAIRVGKRTKRVKSIILTDDDILVGTCVSESGNSEWNFALVFDDFGHFTGEYRILSGNDQSEIPKRVGDAIKFQLKPYVHVPNSLRLKVECFLHKVVVVFAIIGVVALVVVGLRAAYEFGGWAPIPVTIDAGISSSDCIGKNYEDTIDDLVEAGFKRSNIDAKPIYDLNSKSPIPEGSLASIYIDGVSGFASDDKFPPSSKITIAYHVYERVAVPISASDAKGMKYYDLVNQLEKAGFFNIDLVPVDDWLVSIREDNVKEISINGQTDFEKDYVYSADSPIIIRYHAK